MNYAGSSPGAGPVLQPPMSPVPPAPRFTPTVSMPSPARVHNETPPPAILPSLNSAGPRRQVHYLLLAVLLLVLLAGGTILTVGLLRNYQGAISNGAPGNASGQVTFFDGPNGNSGTDALRVTLAGLSPAPAGSHYKAWLVDTANEHTTALGDLNAQGTDLALSFAGNGKNGQPGTNLLSSGNLVEITLEQGNVQLPSGKVLLSAQFPPAAFVHIKHILFSFPSTPAKIGLLVGLLAQTRLLNAQALDLQSASGSQNSTAIKCIAQSIIDISEGLQGPDYQPLDAACGASLPAGDGFGILGANGYAVTAATHASLAATQTDATPTIQSHAKEVEIGTTNISNWVTTMQQDALALLKNPSNQTSIAAIVTLADHTFHGVDSNGNGQIDPIAGEEGAATIYQRGQLMASLTLLPTRA